MAADMNALAREFAEMSARLSPSPLRLRLVADLRLAAKDETGAEEAARAALALAPRDANAMTTLARCRMVAGDLGEARAIFLDAVATDADCAVAFDYLTQLEAAAMTAKMAAHLEDAIAAGSLSRDARTKALLALARRNEAIGENEQAFGQIIAAKSIVAEDARRRGAGYRPQATDALVAAMEAMFAAPIEAPPADMPPLIFIIGMPRSGTSLVEQILAAHPNVAGGGEIEAMYAIAQEFAAEAGGNRAEAGKLVAERAAEWRARYLASTPPLSSPQRVVTDKHPLNFWSVGLIRSLFPAARIINLSRAPVDVCLSNLRVRFFAHYDFTNEIDSIAHYYAAYQRMTDHWRQTFPGAVYDVDYEALVADPAPQIAALIAACGLSWDERVLQSEKIDRPVHTHSAAQVRAPINAASIERRERYGAVLKPLEDALARYGIAKLK